MSEYWIFGRGVEEIEMLKARNIMDGDQLREEGSRKRGRAVTGVLKAIKCWTCLEEMDEAIMDM